MKHSKKNSIKTDLLELTIKNSAFIIFASIFLLFSIVCFSVMSYSSQKDHLKKSNFKPLKNKETEPHTQSKVSLLGNNQSPLLITETIQENATDQNMVVAEIDTNEKVEAKENIASEKNEPNDIYISVAEKFLENQPKLTLYGPEYNLEKWDDTVDLTNIEGSDEMVPKFISKATSNHCTHKNIRGFTEMDMWLIRHQEEDGHWDTGKHQGAGTHEIDCAATAAAIYSLLNQGFDDQKGRFRPNIKLGIEWIISKQLANGSWCNNNYVNAICTMCLTEATGRDCVTDKLKEKAELATTYLLSQQNNSGFFDYSGPSESDNMIVTGWCIMALKNAYFCKIKEHDINKAFLKCNKFLNTTEGTNDNTTRSKGLAWYQPNIRGTGNPGGGCQATAILIRSYIGWEREAPWMEAATTGQSTNMPKEYQSMDIHRLFFAQLGLFYNGGKNWENWHKPIAEILVNAQHKEGELKGSWDNNGSSTDFGGRVLNTALINIVLETHYRCCSVMK